MLPVDTNLFLSCMDVPPDFFWMNEPPEHHFQEGLVVHTRGNTDFWQRTHYGFQADNGHALLKHIQGDFVLSCQVRFEPKTQYDQCGLFVRADADCWIKLSTEYENAALSRLGSVVTNYGYSDWATQDVSTSIDERWYRMTRVGSDFILESAEDEGFWKQMRVTHLHNAPDEIQAGLYACSPQGEGFRCCFRALSLTTQG